MKTTVILSTYNSPLWLRKVLHGYFAQNRHDFEIVIADDGSTDETRAMIAALAAQSPVAITHVWQPDEGFQKCRILNKAIAVSADGRLIVSDGDCVPRTDFVDTHLRLARPGHFLTGAYFKLPKSVSDKIDRETVESRQAFKVRWLIRHGMRPNSNFLKLVVGRPADGLFNRLSPARKTWNGHSGSCLRSEAIRVNGFNEDMQYGGLDVEFGLRLQHAGIRPRHIRYSTVLLHLHHGHGYVTPEMRLNSRQVKETTRAQKRIWAERGLDQWRDADGRPALGAQDRVVRYEAGHRRRTPGTAA
ncbi:glycosyltransferase family 2 protein [Rhizobium sp. TRM95111]|uniref:glycosyltransferase family 2 protein n=1 Tax=Rhizobium alarense TaxID=2846851 RepID=UPI001F1E315B|nr:glycosyltransferase family 2 protein [Rhizobium alarense]MCF3642345.1 glycosyltransferase family 2 protein [Rhizobium alarense]